MSEKERKIVAKKPVNIHSKASTSYPHGFKKEGSPLKFNEAKSNKISWSDCRRIAVEHASLMQYEEVVRCCLDYLNRHLTAPSSKPVVDSRSQAKLHIIFACGGNGARWDRFLGLPKQKVDTGDGVPLIQRTINQFSSRFPGVLLSILLRKSDENDFCDIQNIGRIYTTQGPDTPEGIEILETIRRSLLPLCQLGQQIVQTRLRLALVSL